MTTNELQRANNAKPIVRLDIVMGDGSRYRVSHPNFIAHPPAVCVCGLQSRRD